MLSTSVLSFSNKLVLPSSINKDDENLPLGYRSSSSATLHPNPNPAINFHHSKPQRVYERHRANTDHVGNSPLKSGSLGSKLTSVKVKYLGVIRASGRASAILNKGITAIQPELVDLYTIAQRKFVTSVNNKVNSSSYQLIEVCNYGVVIAEPDPSAQTTLSVVGQTSSIDPNNIVVTKVITPLSNIVLWAGIRFNCRPLKTYGRHRLGAAFIPLSCSSAIMKQSAYTPLTTQRSRFLLSLKHPPLFLCVLRKVSAPKIFECHLFACCNVEDAINLSTNLSNVQNGIFKVGSPSIPIAAELPSYSFTSFDEMDSRTLSRQLSSSPTSGDHHPNNQRKRNQSPSIFTDRASRLTVSTDEHDIRCSRASMSNGQEVLNYRRELGFRPWPSSVGPKLNNIHVNHLRSASNVIPRDKKPTDSGQLSQNSSLYSSCQECSINGKSRKNKSLKCDTGMRDLNFINGNNLSSFINDRNESNNYNGYLVHLNYDEGESVNHNRIETHRNVHTNVNNPSCHVSKQVKLKNHQIGSSAATFSEDESSSIMSRFGRRGPGGFIAPKFDHINSNKNHMDGDHDEILNGFNDNLIQNFPIRDLYGRNGSLTFVDDDLHSNQLNPPMVKINYPDQIIHWPVEARNHKLTLYSSHFHRQNVTSPRITSSNSLFRRLGRWRLRSWIRKSFNLRLKRRKKRNRMDLFADRDLRYLSLAEPLDYVGEDRLTLIKSKRLQLNDGDQSEGYFFGMEQINNTSHENKNSYCNTSKENFKAIATQELPEERNGLENLRKLIEKRTNKTNCQIDSLLIANVNLMNNTSERIKFYKRKGKTRADGIEGLSKVDLINELGYLP